MSFTINTLELGTMDNFIHIISDKATHQALVVDPAWDSQAILNDLQSRGLTLAGLLITHSHHDHVSAVNDLLSEHDVPVYLSREEFRIGLLRLKKPTYIADGESITLGKTTITAMLTPGHTVGSLCYRVGDALFTGDTLFIDGCGRCNFYESQVDKLFESLKQIKSLPDQVVIYPGHNYGQQKTDTLGNQKQTNPYLLIETPEFLVEFRMRLQADYRCIPYAPSSLEEMQAIYQQSMNDRLIE